ncbi:helix-turn-helix domain-containing protein [Kineococcus sp. SYSU DK006]|uniref:helix-turn-helix domain-containing protein n=1 Tax=Kineococcus sp. SYSU DK006 TaxID=3383127 RepID=UPI003D7D8EF5
MPKLTLVPTRRVRRRPDPLLRDVLGAVLRRERLAQRRTLADVATAARVSLPYLSEVERGRKEPSSEVLAAVCAALDLALADLLARSGSLVTDLTTTTAFAPAAGAARTSAPTVSLSIAA